MRLDSTADLARAVDHLVAVEPRFSSIVDRHGLPALRREDAGLKSLLRIVTDQLISLKAGQAIWGRLSERLEPFDPDTVLACPEAELRALGLSGAKTRTFHAAARALRSGPFTGPGHGFATEDDMRRFLLAIPGIGPWTVSIYLLTVLRCHDAWPAADLALQHAAMDLLRLPARPGPRDMDLIAIPWRPYRSTAALLLWSHYRSLRHLPQA